MYCSSQTVASTFEQAKKNNSHTPEYSEDQVDDEIEKHVTSRYLIGARGRSKFSIEHQERLDAALNFSMHIINSAITALKTESTKYLVDILSLHFAMKAEEDLSNILPDMLQKLEEMKAQIGQYCKGMPRENQVAKIRDKFPSKEGSALALVVGALDSKYRRLFLTNDLLKLSVPSIATTIIHELSHHFLRTKDYWYNNYAMYERRKPKSNYFEIHDRVTFAEMSYVNETDGKNKTIWSKLRARAAEDEFLRSLCIEEGIGNEQKNKIIMTNADSIVAIIMSLSHKQIMEDEDAKDGLK
ncbi:hypothetical protein [Pseudomonas synxantha]|uniref:hypothetical protein n=1 Tax=Pseudomonas synxantha TaxID=47883 RepID=UPI0006145959|nr:hypothetical protein [Pseudomonas synxantha]